MPVMQLCPSAHALPHLPQLLSSLLRFAHPLSQ
jgi:hypothetical protein